VMGMTTTWRRVFLTSALALAGPLGAQEVTVPESAAVHIDGVIGAEEWAGARWLGGSSISIALSRVGGYLQVGLRTDPLFVASLCLAAGDTVHVFHASSALGHVAYVRDGEDWGLTGGFEWRMRRTDSGSEASQERLDHRGSFGWIANTMAMGAPGETEFQVGESRVGGSEKRLALGLLFADGDPDVGGWPLGAGEDGCTLRSTIAGPPPERAVFETERWWVLVPPVESQR
jgi:hypothetical protein